MYIPETGKMEPIPEDLAEKLLASKEEHNPVIREGMLLMINGIPCKIHKIQPKKIILKVLKGEF